MATELKTSLCARRLIQKCKEFQYLGTQSKNEGKIRRESETIPLISSLTQIQFDFRRSVLKNPAEPVPLMLTWPSGTDMA